MSRNSRSYWVLTQATGAAAASLRSHNHKCQGQTPLQSDNHTHLHTPGPSTGRRRGPREVARPRPAARLPQRPPREQIALGKPVPGTVPTAPDSTGRPDLDLSDFCRFYIITARAGQPASNLRHGSCTLRFSHAGPAAAIGAARPSAFRFHETEEAGFSESATAHYHDVRWSRGRPQIVESWKRRRAQLRIGFPLVFLTMVLVCLRRNFEHGSIFLYDGSERAPWWPTSL